MPMTPSYVEWEKLTLAVFALTAFLGLLIPLRILIHWPLAFYWDYASHIAGTKIMMENGCASIPEWGGYNICTNSAPGFYVASSVFATLFGVKSGVVLAVFSYILLYVYASWKLLKHKRLDKSLIILSLVGTSFSFWWFFKVGRVLELSATLLAALFLVSNRTVFASLAVLHHPTVLIPLLLLSKNKKGLFKSMLIASPYLFVIAMNSSFSKWPSAASAVYSLNLLQAAAFLPFIFPLSRLMTILFSEAVFCSLSGVCPLTHIPIIRNMFPESLIPLAVFQLYRMLVKRKNYRLLAILALVSFGFLVSRQAVSLKRFDSPEFFLPMDRSREWVDSRLAETTGTFNYSCTDLYNYPSQMIMASYAYVEFGLESVYSPFPEFQGKPPPADVDFSCPG